MAATDMVSRERLDSIQLLRGVAAMLVVYNHVGQFVREDAERLGRSLLAPSEELVRVGEIGVDLFFIISGFVMALSARRFTGWQGSVSFLAARLNRIAPLYYLLTLVMIANLLRAGELGQLEPASFTNSLTFIPIFDDEIYSSPIHFLGWTLAFEFTFYVFVAVQISTMQSSRPLVLLAVVASLPLLHPLAQGTDMVWQMGTSPLLWEFALGILCYVLWERSLLKMVPRRLLGMFALLAAAVPFILALVSGPSLSFLAYDPVNDGALATRAWVFGLPCFVIVCFAINRRVGSSLVARLGRVLGNASYSLYLTHVIVLIAFSKVVQLLWLPADAYVIIGLVTCAIVAVVVYRCVEKPMLEVGQRRLSAWLSKLEAGNDSIVAVVQGGLDPPRGSN